MENLPTTTPEKETESKDSKKSKKKLGSFVVSPVSEHPKAESEEKQSWFSPKPTAEKPVEALPSNEQDEAVAPLEQLSSEERDFAVRSIIEDAQQHDPELAGDDEASLAAAEAVAQFRNEVLENGQDINEAEAAVLEELGVESKTDTENIEAETPEEPPHEFEEGTIDLSDKEDAPDEPADPILPLPPVSAGGNGAGTPPPRVPNSGPTASMPPTPPPRRGAATSAIPIAAVAPFANPNLAAAAPVAAPEQFIDRANPAGAALVGGIIGYFIGRRRGRIKTEKRLLPIQNKLQKEVTDLQWQVKAKEANIRKLAIQQANAGKLPTRETKIAQSVAHTIEQRTASVAERIPQTKPIKNERENSKDQIVVPEAIIIRNQPEAPTHIGHMIVTAESRPSVQKIQEKLPKRQPEKISKPAVVSPEKRAETLNRAELLQMSETIIVDGTSLRQIYETKLVGEKGLRRLVREHLRGGNLKKALRREIVEREIDFERDPVLRDKPSALAAAVAGGTATSLQQLLKQADAAVGSSTEETVFLKARANYEAREQVRDQQRRRVMDISFITIIATLLSTILVLMVR